MTKKSILIVLPASLIAAALLYAQSISPTAPFTKAEADRGAKIAAESLRVRKQITNMRTPAEPFKIMGNLYFVGVANGECYLLTSPKGHILFGAAFSDTVDQVAKNIEAVGFHVKDIKVIVVNHNHADQSGGTAELQRRSGARVMAGFAEVPYLEHGGRLPAGTSVPNNVPPPAAGGGTYPPVHVDRALFNGDVVNVGPLKFTAYLAPGHAASPTSFLYTVKEDGHEYRVFEFCCWEYPEDLSRNAFINEANVRHNIDLFRKVLPVDIYLETGAYGWSGTLNQSSGTILERMAKLKQDHKLFVNPDIFKSWSAAREVEFDEKLEKLRQTNPVYQQ
jgi:hypothetical protein